MKKAYFLIISFLLFSIILNLSCTKKDSETARIGAILPLTGNLSFMGELERNGMQIALDFIKDNNIEIVFEDSRGTAKDGITAANKLISIQKTNIIITSTTGVSRSVLSLLGKSKFLLSAFCMDPTIQLESDYVLRLYYGMEQEAETILDYLSEIKSQIPDKLESGVGILHVNHQGAIQQTNDYFVPGLKELGISLKLIESYEFTQKDFKNIISKIKASRIKYLILIGYGFVYPEIMRNLKEYEILDEITILGGWGFIAQKNISDDLLEGVIVAFPKAILEGGQFYKEFVQAYRKKFQKEPNFDAALAFDNIIIIENAIKLSGDLVIDNILKNLKNRKHNTSMGEVFIDNHGKLEIPMGIGIYENGKIVKWQE